MTTVSEAAGTVRTGTATDLYQFITCLLKMVFLLTVQSYVSVEFYMVLLSGITTFYFNKVYQINQIRLGKNALFIVFKTTRSNNIVSGLSMRLEGARSKRFSRPAVVLEYLSYGDTTFDE